MSEKYGAWEKLILMERQLYELNHRGVTVYNTSVGKHNLVRSFRKQNEEIRDGFDLGIYYQHYV